MKESSKREVRLYNLLFPIWVLIFIPSMWLIVLPANFAIDSLVILLTLLYLRRRAAAAAEDGETPNNTPIWKDWLRCIIPVWLIGFVCDLIGSGFMIFWGYIPGLLADGTPFGMWWEKYITDPLTANPFQSVPALVFAMLGVALAALLIYRLNSRISFRRLSVSEDERNQLAISLAVFTAPYVMLLPSQWFWNGQM